jgi:hypothetical protein
MPRSIKTHDQQTNPRDLTSSELRSSDLTELERQLLTLCHRIEHGYIGDLAVHGGQPVLDPEPRIVREIRLKGSSGAREDVLPRDFVLKTQMVELIRHLAEFGDGLVRRLDVQEGLPFRISFEGWGSYAVHLLDTHDGPQDHGR